ncbi:MAG: hypothetical protein OSB05_16695 [Akkermansiaceae bacterium]|nr:hypothetical protein [Akkermansiaceae bacterium]
MTAKAESLGKTIDLKELPAEKNAGILFSGYLHIQEAGDWTFHCQSPVR